MKCSDCNSNIGEFTIKGNKKVCHECKQIRLIEKIIQRNEMKRREERKIEAFTLS